MKRIIFGICVMLAMLTSTAQTGFGPALSQTGFGPELSRTGFCIAKDGKAATIVVDENDWKGVLRAANDLSDDIKKVSGVKAEVAVANSSFFILHL